MIQRADERLVLLYLQPGFTSHHGPGRPEIRPRKARPVLGEAELIDQIQEQQALDDRIQ